MKKRSCPKIIGEVERARLEAVARLNQRTEHGLPELSP